MMFKIKHTKEVVFISLLGVNITKGHYRKLGICDEITTQALIELILENNTQQIVIDCSSLVYSKDQKVFERFTTHPLLKDREVVFFNIEQQLVRRLQKDLVSNHFQFVIDELQDEYFSFSQITNVLINISSLEEIDVNVCEELTKHDAETLKLCAKAYKEEGYQLKSTPLWTNYYIEINAIFIKKPTAACWLLSRLCQLFRDKIDSNTYVLLASTSLNGTILTSFLKEILSDSYSIELACFDRLGPDLMVNELSRIRSNEYDYVVYLCDFVIGGTEFKILKALLALRKLEVTDVIAVGSYASLVESKVDNIPFERIFHLPKVLPDIKYGLTKESVIN
ncbi:MAG: hypothetical protein JXQ87_14045 [Bacteroidia bacterium]